MGKASIIIAIRIIIIIIIVVVIVTQLFLVMTRCLRDVPLAHICNDYHDVDDDLDDLDDDGDDLDDDYDDLDDDHDLDDDDLSCGAALRKPVVSVQQSNSPWQDVNFVVVGYLDDFDDAQ